MAILHIIEGFGAGLKRELGQTAITIGRDPANHIQIGDPKASRTHVRISWNGSAHQLVDLDSSNGTWNDQGRLSQLILHPETLFRIGTTYFRYESTANATHSHTAILERSALDWQDPTRIETLAADASFLTSPHDDPTDLARANQFLVLLYRFIRESEHARTVDELFERLDDLAADALEGDRCAIFLPQQDGWTLWPKLARRLTARFGNTPFARTLLQKASEHPEPALCTWGGDYDLSQSMVQAGLRSAMIAPLRIGEEVHALLYVDRLHGDASFGRDDLEFLAAVANQLAVRMLNQTQVAALHAEVDRLKQQVVERQPLPDLIGSSPAMLTLRRFIDRAAPTLAPVLLLGESGTGKEVVAQTLHRLSTRHAAPMQTINCAAMTDQQFTESLLFGHLKGAFPGAEDSRPGLFELADQGTLFLDEIASLRLETQAKLLRAIEQGETQRLGENARRSVDVRVIAATNSDLATLVETGDFRADLFHRLNVLTITLAPLRERPEDLDPLIDYFLDRTAERLESERKHLTAKARAALHASSWPGNVRELKNLIERCAILVSGSTIDYQDLPPELSGGADARASVVTSPITSLANMERAHILRVLDHCQGNKKASAEILGIDRSTLYAKLRQYG